MKILAVGDIHTKAWIVDKIEKLVDDHDAVVFCGDYADDWGKEATDTLATWKRLWELQNKYPEKVKLVLGNHDFIYINHTPTLQSGYNSVTQLAINAPANKYLKDWLLSLPVTLEVDGVMFSHAGVAKGWNGKFGVEDLWHDNSPIWVRPSWGQYLEVPQVFGHTPSETCWEVHPNIWCIDTFSTFQDGSPIGDQTVLQIVDGKTFTKIDTNNDQSENSNNTPRKSD
jgi:hypothetical protein